MPFFAGKTIDCYLTEGWKVVSPLKEVCSDCGTALLWHKSYPFTYCVDCARVAPTDGQAGQAGDMSSVDHAAQQPDQHNGGARATTSDTATTLLGNYLLQGYSMSALPCPNNCNVPLLRDPADKRLVLCVACQFKSVAATFAEPAPVVDSKAIAHDIAGNIAKKIGVIANYRPGEHSQQDRCEGHTNDISDSVAAKATPSDDQTASSTRQQVGRALDSKLLALGEQLAAVPLGPVLNVDAQKQISRIAAAMRDITDARRLLLSN